MNQGYDRLLAGLMILAAFIACLAYGIHLAIDVLATLGFTHWHWWLGFGAVGLTFGVCVAGEDEEDRPEPRHRCVVVPLRAAPRERIRAMGGGNARVTAEDRWGSAA